MTCGNCARSVERKLLATPGVTKATVDLVNQNATVEYDAARSSPKCSPLPCATWLRSPRMKTAAPERIDLPVSGMTCAACARAIERTLAAAPGVERAARQPGHQHRHRGVRPAPSPVSAISSAPSRSSGYGVPEKDARSDEPSRAIAAASSWPRSSPLPVIVLGMLTA